MHDDTETIDTETETRPTRDEQFADMMAGQPNTPEARAAALAHVDSPQMQRARGEWAPDGETLARKARVARQEADAAGERAVKEASYGRTDQAKAKDAREAREKAAEQAAAEIARVRAEIDADPAGYYRKRIETARADVDAAEAALIAGDEVTERAVVEASNRHACARLLLKVTEKRGNK